MRRLPELAHALLAAIAVLGAANLCPACQVPVFRYALERWRPDPYTAVVVHEGKLTAAQQALLARLERAAAGEDHALNLVVRSMDLQELSDQDRQALGAMVGSAPQPPYLVLMYPPFAHSKEPAWVGPLEEDSVSRVLDSPVRRRIVKQLLAGQSAVFVLIESGEQAADEAAAALLEQELAANAERLELPEATVLRADEFYLAETKVELKISFSLVRLRRDDPAESVFLATLLNSEKDLAAIEGPIALAVFGRGRGLFAMVDQGINPDVIAEDCHFLTGPCSCQVKEQNPGTDLLFAVDWDHAITDTAWEEKPLPELSGLGNLVAVSQSPPAAFAEDTAAFPERQARAEAGAQQEPQASKTAGGTRAPAGYRPTQAGPDDPLQHETPVVSSEAEASEHFMFHFTTRLPLWVPMASAIVLLGLLLAIGTVILRAGK